LATPPEMERLDLKGAGPEHAVYRVTLPDGSVDYVLLAEGLAGTKHFSSFETEAGIAVVRTGPLGSVLRSDTDSGLPVRIRKASRVE
jgi:hypothetical protein